MLNADMKCPSHEVGRSPRQPVSPRRREPELLSPLLLGYRVHTSLLILSPQRFSPPKSPILGQGWFIQERKISPTLILPFSVVEYPLKTNVRMGTMYFSLTNKPALPFWGILRSNEGLEVKPLIGFKVPQF